MYNGFFGFKEKPFRLIPNPDYLFLGKSHEEALAHLAYAIAQGDGFVEITGEVGAGKTTLCRAFLEDLDKKIDAAFIFNPKLTSSQLLKTLHKELGIEPASSDSDIIDLTHSLNQFLLQRKAQGKSVILLIDEAQHLSTETLEQLRLLSNLETTKNKLLQIVLVGQPELSEVLDAFNMRQLRQRINLSCHILPLTREETQTYIKHRVNIASFSHQDLFTLKARKIIYEYSNGTPRKINILCDRSLLAAYSLNKKKITADVVNIALKELQSHQLNAPAPKRHKIALVPLLSVIIALTILFLAYNHIPSKWVSHSPEPVAYHSQSSITGEPVQSIPVSLQNIPKKVIPPVSTDQDLPEAGLTENRIEKQTSPDPSGLPLLTSPPKAMDRKNAVKLIFSLWGVPALNSPDLLPSQTNNDFDFFKMHALHNNFLILHIDQWDIQVEKFNLPAVLKLASDDDSKEKYIVVSKITRDNEYVFSDQSGEQTFKIAKKDLYPLLKGDCYIVCKNIFGYSPIIAEGSDKFSILSAKLLLREIGYRSLKPDSDYNASVKNAVRQIQKKYNLAEDGLIGPMTKLVLMQEKNDPSVPFISDTDLSEISDEALK